MVVAAVEQVVIEIMEVLQAPNELGQHASQTDDWSTLAPPSPRDCREDGRRRSGLPRGKDRKHKILRIRQDFGWIKWSSRGDLGKNSCVLAHSVDG